MSTVQTAITPSALDRKTLGNLTLEQTIYLAVLLLALFLRFYHLGVRPYHHDESIHAFFSWKITQQGVGDYRYDPVYHGPVLYYATALVMLVLGDSDFTGRISAVLFGLGILAFAWPMRRHLGRWGALCFFVLVGVSPAWLYFTRFVRHDIYLALCNLAAVFFAFRYGETRRPHYLYLSSGFLALAFCTKEDNYFLTPIFLVAFALMLVWEVLYARDRKAAWRQVWGETTGLFRQAWLPLITSGVIFVAIWLIFYTSFGQHPENWNGFTRAIHYWVGQHEIKRIGGHWSYYLPQLVLYEPLDLFPLCAVVLGLFLGAQPRDAFGRFCFYAAIVASLAFFVALFAFPAASALILLAALGLIMLALATVWMPDRFTRFSVLWSLAALCVYGWAQEKVPWLLIPQLLPLTLVAGHWYGRLIERRAFAKPAVFIPFGIVGALTVWTMISANFIWDAPKPDEPGAKLNPPVRHEEMLAYVQSTYDINKVVGRIDEVAKQLDTGLKTRLAVSGDATWPLSWYLRHYPVNWSANLRNIDFPVVVVDKGVAKSTDDVLLKAYERVPFEIRGWWEPNWSELSPYNLLRFLVTRQVWSPVGSSDSVMYVHKDLKPGMSFATLTVNPPPAARGYPRQPAALEALAVWGKQGSARGEFNEPRGLATDSKGDLYVVDSKNDRIQKLSSNGEVLAVWGSEGPGDGQFKDPCGIAVGPDDSVYVADTWNHRIEKFDPNGTFLRKWNAQDTGFWGPRGVAVSADGTVFVTDTGNKRVVSFNSDGVQIDVWGSDGSAPSHFIEPVGIAVNSSGEVAVADTGNRRLQFFRPDGTFVREWPIYGWEEFYTEPYVATEGDDIFVTDSYNHRFARYDGGKLTGVWGKSGSASGEFNRPIGIAAAGNHIVYVSDTFNHRIQKFRVPGPSE